MAKFRSKSNPDIVLEGVEWDGFKVSETLHWIRDATQKGPTDDGGGLVRMRNEVHLFQPGEPADPETALIACPGAIVLRDSDGRWLVGDENTFEPVA